MKMIGEHLVVRYRFILKLVLHGFIFVLAFLGAYFLRFEFTIPYQYLSVIRDTIPVLLLAKAAGFSAFGLFRGWWRYVGIRDVLPIAGGCTLGSLLFLVSGFFIMYPRTSIPRSVYAIDWLLTFLFVLGARYVIRFGRETYGRRNYEANRRVLVVGAGAAGQMIVREIRANPMMGMVEIGFVDDDRAKLHARIDGVPVLGNHKDIPRLCEEHRI
ncbi:MAG: nucleoside-diphosphate sugar epimerase, partial [Deltaproteobacteria bacterium]|nr:nucleoside-diphosphate sugar epimerase [Deltaproteobacteria bacterium]